MNPESEDSLGDQFNTWPSFVDLLAATSLLFITLVAVFIYIANEEAGEFRTQRKRLAEALERIQGRDTLYSVQADAQFVRVTLQEDATFPTAEWRWGSLRED